MRIGIFVRTALAALLAAPLHAALAAAAPAGSVVYAYGQVNATGGDGASRTLKRGDQVYSGDTLQTVNGRTQVRFSDGGFAALQPNTQYRIDDYSYGGAGDGTSRSFFNLVKGGVRFVSGAVGRINKDNYRIQTAVATIGIRGSAGRVWTDGQRMEAVCHRDGLYAEQNGRRTNFDAGQGVACSGSDCNVVETGSTAESTETMTQTVTENDGDRYTQGDEFLAVGSAISSTAFGPVGGGYNLPFISGGNGFISLDTFPDSDSEAFVIIDNAGRFVGGLEISDNEFSLFTNNLDAVLANDNAEAVAILQQTIGILDAEGADALAMFRTDPADLVEANQFGDFVWGGFANGYVLQIDGYNTPNHPPQAYAQVAELRNHQVMRFFGGPPASEPGTVFKGLYTQFATFNASNASGTATGTVSNGSFEYIFGMNQGTLGFAVVLNNGRSYEFDAFVQADMAGFPFLSASGAVFGDAGSPGCHPSCGGFALGTFLGNGVTVTGRTLPEFAGFSFVIDETKSVGGPPDWVGGIIGLQATDTTAYP